jgi:hypothetical protein
MKRSVVWLIGQTDHAEFAPPVAWLRRTAACEAFGDVAHALERAHSAVGSPDAILLVQSRPGQYGRHEVERLHAAAPLAALAALVGPWCEGEARSGRPWPGVARTAWWAWQSRLPLALGLAPDGRSRLPRTASETERIEQGFAAFDRLTLGGRTAVIWADRRDAYEALADALGVLGITATWRLLASPDQLAAASLCVFLGWEHPVAELAGNGPRVLALAFPRPEDRLRAAALGIRALVALPLLISDLAAACTAALEGGKFSSEKPLLAGRLVAN